MDKHLQKLLQELGEAINDAVNESDEVNRALERLRVAGHEVFLVLEATIAFKEAKPDEEPLPFREVPIEQRLEEISHEDRQFLRSLNIKFDKDE